MGRYLTMALFCEGREDERFLAGVIERQAGRLGMEGRGFAVGAVESQPCRTTRAAEQLDGAVLEAADAYDLVFLHNDHNERGKTNALRSRLKQACPPQTRFVPVIPVRETEAWMLADRNALPSGATAHGLPAKPREVGSLSDPKKTLAAVLGRPLTSAVAEQIGERIDLDRLAEVPAYQTFLQDLTTALKELNFR
jgi:hypothetical protein